MLRVVKIDDFGRSGSRLKWGSAVPHLSLVCSRIDTSPVARPNPPRGHPSYHCPHRTSFAQPSPAVFLSSSRRPLAVLPSFRRCATQTCGKRVVRDSPSLRAGCNSWPRLFFDAVSCPAALLRSIHGSPVVRIDRPGGALSAKGEACGVFISTPLLCQRGCRGVF